MKTKTEIKFKRDTSFRKQFFVPDSFAHPAKMDAQLLIWIVEKYTQPGETILDPMAGSGTTMLACTLGRNCILVELEEKFCKMMADNWNEVRMRPQLGYSMGDCQIIQGDARQLEGLLVDKCIFSPPYAVQEGGKTGLNRIGQSSKTIRHYAQNPDNIDELPYGQIDKIVTSPPYEGSNTTGRPDTYNGSRGPFSQVQLSDYRQSKDNIGNLKSESYLEAMLQVYQQCHSVLKPQGLMILVTKNFIRNKQVVRLDTDTIKLCEQAGFTYLERHYRKLPAQSFWRTIYHQKHPEVEKINHEDVLVFNKKLASKSAQS